MNQIKEKSLAEIIELGVKLTPMMEQYWEIKSKHPDVLLLFRMGDFYELFFEDAKKAAELLNISLTHRGKLGGFPIPMAGIPHHAASVYVDRATQAGHKVVICEQVEDPKQAKGIVKRAVSQIVSPGMPFDLDKSQFDENRFICCAYYDEKYFWLTTIDFTTGDFFAFQFNQVEQLIDRLLLLKPKEFVCSLGQWEKFPELEEAIDAVNALKTNLSSEYFEVKYTDIYLEKFIPHFNKDKIITANPSLLRPLGAITYYICSTQPLDKVQHIRPFSLINSQKNMKVSFSTLKGLEILPKDTENYRHSLLGFMDQTRTSMGRRYIKDFFKSPLKDKVALESRLKNFKKLFHRPDLIELLREELIYIKDIDRIMAKASTGKTIPGDLLALAGTLKTFISIKKNLAKIELPFLALPNKDLQSFEQLEKTLTNHLNEEIGASLEKGNLIKAGVNKKRDRLKKLTDSAQEEVKKLEDKYRQQTGINNLKIKSTNISGFFIEISKSHLNKVPKSFQRRQTLVNSERYISDELTSFERELTEAQDKLMCLEREIFNQLIQEVLTLSSELLTLAKNIASLDTLQSLCFVSIQNEFTEPVIDEKNKVVSLKGCWHPLIKANIKDQFVGHNIELNENTSFALITGPNMAGKTTVMREVAIIQYLAQLGCYVPALRAQVGLCDYLFSRLGASDDIIRGQSTFMVEMSETAEILRHASPRSLIILDEIGRGTSTYDGLSIAWSLVEYFVQKLKALTLFATHYHELIEVVDNLPGAKNLTVRTEEKNGKVKFLYELIESGATQSFGIHVAEMAGLPKEVLKRSKFILSSFEEQDQSCAKTTQLSFFEPQSSKDSSPQKNHYLSTLQDLDISKMTPLEALNTLNQLKNEMIQ